MSPFGIDDDRRDVVHRGFLQQGEAEAGLAGAGHAEHHAVGDQVLGVVEHQIAVGLFGFRIVSAAEVKLAELFVIDVRCIHDAHMVSMEPENASAYSVCAAASEKSRPNILFIFSDDHALQAISAYGGRFKDIAPTPNIDRLATQGAIFERSYCANSICGPSRACILTGKHSHINGFIDNSSRFNGAQPTFPNTCNKPATRPPSSASGTS
jgi:hypothetical protein